MTDGPTAVLCFLTRAVSGLQLRRQSVFVCVLCVCVCECVCILFDIFSQCLTVCGAEAPGGGDHREGGAGVDGAQVVLHVGADVGVRGAEGRLPRGRRVRGEADERHVRHDRTAG